MDESAIEISRLRRVMQIGAFASMDTLCDQVTAQGLFISPWAKNAAERANTLALDEPVEAGTIMVTIIEPITYGRLCQIMTDRGKKLCLPEFAFQELWQYPFRTHDECLRFAMKPITDKAGHQVIFRIQTQKGTTGIYSTIAHEKLYCCKGEQFVFSEDLVTVSA